MTDGGRGTGGWSAVRTGVLQIALVAAVAASVFFLDLVLREAAEGPELFVRAPEARELTPGAEVWVAGVPAGRVTAVRFGDGAGEEAPVLIRTVLRGEAASTLRSDASATIRQSALLAPSVVAVSPGRAPTPFDFADTLRARPLVGGEEVGARLDSLAGELEALRPLGRRLARRIEEGPGTMAALRSDTVLSRELEGLADRVDALAGRVPSGSAARLAADDSLAATWDSVARRARRIARGIEEGAGPVRAALDSLAASASAVGRRMEERRGSLARFLGDGALARELRTMRARTDSLRRELLAEPLRWLRFRLF